MQRVAEACNAIINSNQTYIIGLGYIGIVANYLNVLIRSHVPQVHAITEYNGMLFDYMGHFTRRDVVIAIGFDKCQNQTIKAFKTARERGATTIMITDSEYSPLCPYSKYGLFTHNAPNYFLSPLIGAFSLCNALLHGIVEITKPHSTKRSAAYNKLLNEEKSTIIPNSMKEVIGTIALIMLAGIPAAWPQSPDSATFRVVENMYRNFATERKIPGLAFGIVIGGKLAYAKGIGYSDDAKAKSRSALLLFTGSLR